MEQNIVIPSSGPKKSTRMSQKKGRNPNKNLKNMQGKVQTAKTSRCSKKVILGGIFLLAIAGGVSVFIVLQNNQDSYCASIKKKSSSDFISETICNELACPFDVSLCDLACPFGYSKGEDGCPNACTCGIDSSSFEGDIIVTEKMIPRMLEEYGYKIQESDGVGVSLFAGAAPVVDIWDQDFSEGKFRIPYDYSKDPKLSFPIEDVGYMEGLLDTVSYLTCANFVKRTVQKEYIEFIEPSNIKNKLLTCTSAVGRQTKNFDKGIQPVYLLSSKCIHGKMAMHQVLHVLGLHHEHVRSDRDLFIKVNLNNVRKGFECYFGKLEESHSVDLKIDYDYESMLQMEGTILNKKEYPPFLPVMVRLDTGEVLERGLEFTGLDIAGVNNRYGCNEQNSEKPKPSAEEGNTSKEETKEGSNKLSTTAELPSATLTSTQSATAGPHTVLRWDEWSSWSKCENCKKTSITHRTRICLGGPNLRKDCVRYLSGEAYEEANCIATPQCKNKGNWGNWQPWAHCPSTCGFRQTQTRLRVCLGKNCVGNSLELRKCDKACFGSAGGDNKGGVRPVGESGGKTGEDKPSIPGSVGSGIGGGTPIVTDNNKDGTDKSNSKNGSASISSTSSVETISTKHQVTDLTTSLGVGIGYTGIVTGSPESITDGSSVGPIVTGSGVGIVIGGSGGTKQNGSSIKTGGSGTGSESGTDDGSGPYVSAENLTTPVCNKGASTFKFVMDPVWGPWEHWVGCPKCTKTGRAQRKRQCYGTSVSFCLEKFQAGKDISTEYRDCSEIDCVVKEWNSWTDFNQCSTKCGGGARYKKWCHKGTEMEIINKCINPEAEWKQCNPQPCTENDYKWSEWSAWVGCHVCASLGKVWRRRGCIGGNPSDCQRAGRQCDTKIRSLTYEQKRCNDKTCESITIYKWSEWNKWEVCHKSCGGGYQLRHRECEGGAYGCTGGKAYQIMDCNTAPCAVSGWGPWSNQNYGDCSESCGPGVVVKIRMCLSEIPQECPGLNVKTVEVCKKQEPCPAGRVGGVNLRKNLIPSIFAGKSKPTSNDLCSDASDVQWVFGDFNGDKKSDALCAETGGHMEIGLGNSAGVFQKDTDSNTQIDDCYQGLKFSADFNNDGFDDLLCQDKTQQKLTVVLSDYGKFYSTADYDSQFCTATNDKIHIMDSNGDNKLDIVCDHKAGNYEILYSLLNT